MSVTSDWAGVLIKKLCVIQTQNIYHVTSRLIYGIPHGQALQNLIIGKRRKAKKEEKKEQGWKFVHVIKNIFFLLFYHISYQFTLSYHIISIYVDYYIISIYIDYHTISYQLMLIVISYHIISYQFTLIIIPYPIN